MGFLRRSPGELVFEVFNTVLIGFISLVCIYPMLHVLLASFSEPLRIMNHQGPLLRPLGFSLEGYRVVFNTPSLFTGYRNTIFYVVIGSSLNMVMTTLGAYTLAQRDFLPKKFCMLFIVFTMYFTGGIIPNFLLVRNLGMLNTRWALIIPGAIGTWNMLVLRTAFLAVPRAMEDAARIDGANDLVILIRIMVPVSRATMAVVLLFYAVGHWNAWFNAMIYLPRARDLYPLQLFLREILISNSEVSGADTSIDFVGELVKYSTTIVSTVPILCLYPFLQRYFVKGVMMGSVKE
ncbi:MAG: carbohydrate ABC transporter permease [Treponema sp.]|jgi:putative aldouronate transport system permease protein|nr:carbohydrate ABC transporter permease [Treponema sp.]